jgi:hypothetical protein
MLVRRFSKVGTAWPAGCQRWLDLPLTVPIGWRKVRRGKGEVKCQPAR